MAASNLTEHGPALHAISQIFKNAYGAAKSVDGAYERIQEKICGLRSGVKIRRDDFISTEAIIHVISSYLKITEEEAKLRHDNKSKEKRRETLRAIHKNDELWNEARKFDRTDHGGQKFVTLNIIEFRIEFSFKDGRSITFDLAEMVKYKGFRKLYPKFVVEGRKQLIKTTEVKNINEIEMARVVSDRISETTLWEKRLVSQAVEKLSSSDKSYLYTHIQLLSGSIRKAAMKSNKEHDKISVQDVLRAIQIVIECLDEQ